MLAHSKWVLLALTEGIHNKLGCKETAVRSKWLVSIVVLSVNTKAGEKEKKKIPAQQEYHQVHIIKTKKQIRLLHMQGPPGRTFKNCQYFFFSSVYITELL